MQEPLTPQMLEKVRKLSEPVRNMIIEKKEKMSGFDRMALFITDRIGTLGFFFIIFLWTVLWLAWNTFAPQTMRFDAYPGFLLWLFISNVIQLFLMPMIMVGQNLQGKHAEARSESDFEFNIKGELEIERLIRGLEVQNTEIMRKLEELEKRTKM